MPTNRAAGGHMQSLPYGTNPASGHQQYNARSSLPKGAPMFSLDSMPPNREAVPESGLDEMGGAGPRSVSTNGGQIGRPNPPVPGRMAAGGLAARRGTEYPASMMSETPRRG